MNGVLKTLEETLADVQRVDAKAQSALDLKKQNVKDENKKRKELVKSMEEVTVPYVFLQVEFLVKSCSLKLWFSFDFRTRKCLW